MGRFIKYISFIFLLLATDNSFAQDENDFNNITSQREEIQRYFGYEILPFRYLSLPFDVTVNNNERAIFLDIGFLYFAFLPLFLLLYLKSRNRTAFYVCLAATLFVLIVGASNSFVFSDVNHETMKKEGNEIESNRADLASFLLSDVKVGDLPMAHISAYSYYLASFIYEPLYTVFSMFSGNKDMSTYPLLVLLFILSSFLLHKVLRKSRLRHKILVIIYWSFLFFWLKYSAGIIWYGFLILVLGLALIFKLMAAEKSDGYPLSSKFLKYSFYSLSLVWILSAILLRMGEVQNNLQEQDLGKSMFNSTFYKYQVGELSGNEVLTAFYPRLDIALSKMNSETESLILRVGTSFSYFIKNNSDRILMDNQLGIFNLLRSRYEDDDVLIDVLKASNFKYLIIDLNTPFIDKTPEGTLKKKYKLLRRFIRGNTSLRMLTTNRIIQETDKNTGQPKNYYGMFPEPDTDGKILYGGQYVIYEII